MTALSMFTDSLRNLVANIGTSRDKASSSHYSPPLLSDQDILNAYRGAWLPRKIIDIPALDACRNWRGWAADGVEISRIEAEETRLGLQAKVLEAVRKARLWGGAAIYIGTGDPDPMLPLDPSKIGAGGLKHLNVLTRRILSAGQIDTNAESSLYGRPREYTLSSNNGMTRIHPSRLVVFEGAPHPDPELASGVELGWGDSVLMAILDQIKQADSTAANIASLVFEAKIDVIKIPGFMAGLQDKAYEAQVLQRLSLAATAKGINGCLILDKEEEYDQKSAAFSELTNILLAFMQLVSGAADIPITRLLGQSPGGLNASGDNDIRNYYDRIAAMQTLTITPAMALLDECLIRSALGERPPELFYNWRSLWQTSDKERADIGKTTAESIKAIGETGLIPDDVMSKVAVNMLTEAGIAPGLENEMAEWAAANPDGEEAEDDDLASMNAVPVVPAVAPADIVADAAPRTLYVHRRVTNAAEIIAWAKTQGFTSTLPASDMHVTIAFSRQPVDWMKLSTDWGSSEDGGLRVAPGGPRLLERFDGGAVVLLFNASMLSWRHESIKEAGATWDHPDYQPHITLTYDPGALELAEVEPYRGAIELGPEIFEELDLNWARKVREE